MTADENTPTPNHSTHSQPVAVARSAPVDYHDTGWLTAPGVAPPVEAPSPGVTAYLQALRRRWLMSALLGVLGATVIGLIVWFSQRAQYTARAYLRIDAKQERLVFPTAAETLTNFDVFKGTQRQLVKSPFVLQAALTKPEIARLRMVQREVDSVAWLTEELQVEFPGKAEIMEVSLSGEDPQAVADLVNAVVRAYVDEVVNVERDRRGQRLSKLQQARADKEGQLSRLQNQLKGLIDPSGTADPETLALMQQIALQRLAGMRAELMRLQFQLRRWQGDLKAKEALVAAIDQMLISDVEVEMAAGADPIGRRLLDELASRRNDLAVTVSVAASGTRSPYVERSRRDLQRVQDQLKKRNEELRMEIRRRKSQQFAEEIEQLRVQIAVGAEDVQLLEKQVEEQRSEALKLGRSTFDIEMTQSQIQQIERALDGIAEEQQRLDVEIRSTPRINLIQDAQVPKSKDRTTRLALTILAALVGLCAPAACIAWWDTRARLISSPAEVSRGLGLPVIGSVPMIPTRIIRELGLPTKRHQAWRMRLTESIDGVAARLLRKGEVEKNRVILITSALGGEGKTTLATQLALSLARNAHRTVLVDFDLRRPGFHEVFGLPLTPGVSEVLRRESETSAVVHETNTDNLSAVTAGEWDRNALAALANGAAAPLFERLREEYDFVVVDSCPILPVADTRFVSQHVDTVILSVFRDVSRAPKISEACEILEAFGVRELEAVVTGPSQGLRSKDLDYESRLPVESVE